jgi:hypothetical protein
VSALSIDTCKGKEKEMEKEGKTWYKSNAETYSDRRRFFEFAGIKFVAGREN